MPTIRLVGGPADGRELEIKDWVEVIHVPVGEARLELPDPENDLGLVWRPVGVDEHGDLIHDWVLPMPEFTNHVYRRGDGNVYLWLTRESE